MTLSIKKYIIDIVTEVAEAIIRSKLEELFDDKKVDEKLEEVSNIERDAASVKEKLTNFKNRKKSLFLNN